MTDYRILAPEADISAFFGEPHGWPTVVAIRETKIIGAMSTHRKDDSIICGPVKVDLPGRTVFVAFRLIEKYDQYLLELGIAAYYLGLDVENRAWVTVMDKFIKRYRNSFYVEPLGAFEGQQWYRRLLVARRSWAQKLRRSA